LKKNPRVRFCWECGKKLWGNYHIEEMFEGFLKIFHKDCWLKIKEGRRDA